MALQVEVKKRVFIVKIKGKDVELPDPHPNMTLDEVKHHYKAQHPEISTATLQGPKLEENKAVYSFKTVLGDKG